MLTRQKSIEDVTAEVAEALAGIRGVVVIKAIQQSDWLESVGLANEATMVPQIYVGTVEPCGRYSHYRTMTDRFMEGVRIHYPYFHQSDIAFSQEIRGTNIARILEIRDTDFNVLYRQ